MPSIQSTSPRSRRFFAMLTGTTALALLAAVMVAVSLLDQPVQAAKEPGPPPAFVTPGLHPSSIAPKGKIRVMILTGQMNRYHDWIKTTPILKSSLEKTGLFSVDIETMPPRKSDLSNWNPRFEDYQVIVMNVDGDEWPTATKKHFEDYVAGGGALSVVHSADNAWKDWKQWNEMIALGGWGGRKADAGPYVKWRDGKQVVVESEDGACGHHGPRHEFVVEMRAPDHPICKGLPAKWLHIADELYDSLRGPAKNLTVVGTAFSAKEKRGTGENEPILMAITYGKGRIFHTTLGHHDIAMRCAGFQTTFTRGTEWAATGKVTQPVPKDFPTADKTVSRED